jgi:hypothetical protein
MFCREARLKTNNFSTRAGLKRRRCFGKSSFSIRCAAGFSLVNFWQENSSLVLIAIFGVIAIGVLLWLIFRRRHEAFPEIKFEVESQAPEKDITTIETRPERAPRSGAFPGIFGKIEVLVNDRQINTYLVTNNPLTIGRDPAQALAIIQEAIVSKLHCSIFCRDGQVFIKDLNSTNGTYVNEEKISEQELHDGDIVSLGRKGTIKIIYHK